MQPAFTQLQIMRMNEIDFQSKAKASRYKAWATYYNVVAAVASSSTIVAILGGGSAHGLLIGPSGLAAILSAAIPLSGLDSKVAQFEKASLGYSTCRTQTQSLLPELKLKDLTVSDESRFGEIQAFESSLIALADLPDHKLIEMSWAQTGMEFPQQ